MTHLYLRENKPLAAAGIVVPGLGFALRKAKKVAEASYSFDEIVEKVRNGPAGAANPLKIPAVDRWVNTVEFFIHHEDLRRAANRQIGPRALAASFDDYLWEQVKHVATLRLRRFRYGVIVQRLRNHLACDQSVVVSTGPDPVTVTGEAGEVMMWLFGRDACEVDFAGHEQSRAKLAAFKLAV